MLKSTSDECYDIMKSNEGPMSSKISSLPKMAVTFIVFVNEILQAVTMIVFLYYCPVIVEFITSIPIRGVNTVSS